MQRMLQQLPVVTAASIHMETGRLLPTRSLNMQLVRHKVNQLKSRVMTRSIVKAQHSNLLRRSKSATTLRSFGITKVSFLVCYLASMTQQSRPKPTHRVLVNFSSKKSLCHRVGSDLKARVATAEVEARIEHTCTHTPPCS